MAIFAKPAKSLSNNCRMDKGVRDLSFSGAGLGEALCDMFCCQKYQIVQPRNPRPKTTMPINGTILDLSFSGFRMSREMRTAQIRKRYIPPNNTALQKRDWGETITARAVKIAAPAKLAKNQRISRICQLLTPRAFSRNRSSANNN